MEKSIFQSLLQIQAVDFKRKNLALPDYLQKELNQMTEEEKLETEIKLIDAEYQIEETKKERQ